MKELSADNPLAPYCEEILGRCAQDAEIGDCDRDGYDYKLNGIYFENDNVMIEGEVRLAGNWHEDGDGYWTPRTSYVTGVVASVDELTGLLYNPETEDFDTEVEDKHLNELASYLEDMLPRYLND